jgi:hypothetical protein
MDGKDFTDNKTKIREDINATCAPDSVDLIVFIFHQAVISNHVRLTYSPHQN